MRKPGDSFERYTIEAPIGQGGMGRVYRAHDPRLGRRVALKVISEGTATPESDERLLREARAAAALDHPNAVSIFDVGHFEGAPYIVMELVSGNTLRSAIGAGDASVTMRIGWLADVARALSAAHRRGLVHRDIKPENVMVREDGMVKVLDFGIARRTGAGVDSNATTQTPALPTLTIEGVKLGTPVYMAPEQIRSEALDGRADQFAWGVLAYELLTGRLPWRGSSDAFAVVASILTDEADMAALDQAGVPPEVRDVLRKTLSKRPDDRFASMSDVVSALDAALKGQAPADARTAPPPRAPAGQIPGGPAQSATMAQRFSTQEVRDVLGQAVERQALKQRDAQLGFEDLLAAAQEVGVDAETLREVSRALRDDEAERRTEARKSAEYASWLRCRRVDLYRHAGVYVIIHAALLALGFILGLPYLWLLSVLALLWGIGLGIHWLVVLTSTEDEWMQEKEGMQWWKEHMHRHQEMILAMAVGNRGVRSLPAAKEQEAARPRVEVPLDPVQARVRVAMDTARERMAEEEAALAERREGKRRRR